MRLIGFRVRSIKQECKLALERPSSVNAVLRELYRSVVKKGSFEITAKLSVFQSVYVPILNSRHESCGMTEKEFSQMQAAEMGVLQRVYGVTLRDNVRRCDICISMKMYPLLRIEK